MRIRNVIVHSVQSMLSDESGAAIFEYAIVLSCFSVVAVLALSAYCTTASVTIHSNTQQMSKYSMNPALYECQVNGGASC
jgi:Flp pilus assembly pilin Flp